MFLIALLTLSGPFGSYDKMGLAERLAYWAGVTVMATLVVNASRAFFQVFAADVRPLWRAVLCAVLSAMLLAPLLSIYSLRLFHGRTDDIPGIPTIAAVVFLVALFVAAIRHYFLHIQQPGAPRLLERLADKNAEEILRISGRDHYVDIYTDCGKETLLMRFSDALAELDGLPGHRVHRSHWVAEAAVRGYRRRDGRAFVVLLDDSELPVSRGYRAEVEAELLSARGARGKPVLLDQS